MPEDGGREVVHLSVRVKLAKGPATITEWGNCVVTCKGIIAVPCEPWLHRCCTIQGDSRGKINFVGADRVSDCQYKKGSCEQVVNVTEIQLFE